MFTKIKNYLIKLDKDGISNIQKIKTNIKRHSTPVTLVLIGILFLWLMGDLNWFNDNLKLVLSGFMRIGLATISYLLITKFAFPKLNIQEGLNANNIAISIFTGLLFIGIALLL